MDYPLRRNKEILSTVIFVFGSNLLGHHGAGAAKDAYLEWGAEYGIGIGRTGHSWAIPTKDENINTLPKFAIMCYVNAFLAYAGKHPQLDFQVTAVGCGLAGYKTEDMAPMFDGFTSNVHLPIEWKKFLA